MCRRYVALNLSSTSACHAFKDAMVEMLPYVDLVFGNRHEARAYAAANQLGVHDIGDIARQMARVAKVNGRRGRIVVITCGRQPTVVVENGTVRR